jgi:hypothetical protein
MKHILALLMLAATLLASSSEDRTLSIEALNDLWNQKYKADEKAYDVDVKIDSEEIIWIDDLKEIPKGWAATIVVKSSDLMIGSDLIPDLQYDYLDKNQKKVMLQVVRANGTGIAVGPNANMSVYKGPYGVRMVGGKAAGLTGTIHCRVFFRKCWVPPAKK